jgi:hypothetical protein
MRICTVCGSSTSVLWIESKNARMPDLVAGSISRSMLNFTAAASALVPSWKRTFLWSLKV